MFAFMAEHREALFPAEMFADMYSSTNGRPSMPPQILAATVVLQSLHGLSDFETLQKLHCDLRRCLDRGGLPAPVSEPLEDQQRALERIRMRLNGVLTAGFALLLGLAGGAVTAPATGAVTAPVAGRRCDGTGGPGAGQQRGGPRAE
ncbi:hypothetical protein [Streptosporangium amethystogenes]|uniref:hypothetical protein n=1 Tax=Streptosporangium amethystogenes TaxID=2002 RepID=UPI001FE1AF3C|nr:hypothetical protein [Streptosporangium amethystogenes]